MSQLKGPNPQSGASAVEFALVLPMLIGLIFAAVGYSYTFVVFTAVNYAAQTGAEAAVAVSPDPADAYQGNVTNFTQAAVLGALNWLPQDLRNNLTVQSFFCEPTGGGQSPNCPQGATGSASVVVSVTLQLPEQGGSIPRFRFPGLGSFPPLPDNLNAVGVGLL